MVESRMEACERRRRRAYKREVEDAQALVVDAREIVRQLANSAAPSAPCVAWRQQLDAVIASMAEEVKTDDGSSSPRPVVKLPGVVDAAVAERKVGGSI